MASVSYYSVIVKWQVLGHPEEVVYADLLAGDPDPVRICLVEEEMVDFLFAVISAVTTNDILVEDKNL